MFSIQRGYNKTVELGNVRVRRCSGVNNLALTYAILGIVRDSETRQAAPSGFFVPGQINRAFTYANLGNVRIRRYAQA